MSGVSLGMLEPSCLKHVPKVSPQDEMPRCAYGCARIANHLNTGTTQNTPHPYLQTCINLICPTT